MRARFRHRMVAAPNPARCVGAVADASPAWALMGEGLSMLWVQVSLDRQRPAAGGGGDPRRSGMRRLQQVFALPPRRSRASLPTDRAGPSGCAARALKPRPCRCCAAGPFPYPHRVRVRNRSQALLFPCSASPRISPPSWPAAMVASSASPRSSSTKRPSAQHARHRAAVARTRCHACCSSWPVSRLDRLRLPAPTRGLQLQTDERRHRSMPAAHATCLDTQSTASRAREQLRDACVPAWGDSAVRPVVLHADHRPERATRHIGKPPKTLPPLPRRQSGCCHDPSRLHGHVDVVGSA